MTRLHVAPQGADPYHHRFEGETLVIGRANDCDLPVADRYLSRKHARLFRRQGRLLIEDLGSRNGTFLNGEPVKSAAAVKIGDEIRISSTILRIVPEGEEPAGGQEFGLETVFRPSRELLKRQEDLAALKGEADLRRRATRLGLLNEVHRNLATSDSLEELLELILDRLFEQLSPEEGAVVLKRDAGYERVAGRTAPGCRGGHLFSSTLAEEVSEKERAALVLDAQSDTRFSGAESILSSGIRSLIAAPLLHPDGSLGMIALSSRAAVRQFDEADLDLLNSMASVAALRIRNLSLAEEAAARRQLEKEVALARRIQLALLPSKLPRIPGYEIHAETVPSRGVSGDFFKIVERGGGAECVFLVADVSGKGIAASLLTATLEALSAVPILQGQPADEICRNLNELLYERTPAEKYATGVVGILEPESGRFSYSSAGHNPLLLLRRTGAEPELLERTGFPLGLMPEGDFAAREVSLEAGDTLVLYTDGFSEAMTPEDEEYGLQRLARVAAAHRRESVADLVAAIQADVDAFVAGQPYEDDRTLVVLGRLGR